MKTETRHMLKEIGADIVEETMVDPRKIDLSLGETFQVRVAIDNDLVGRYEQRFRNGEVPPPIILRQTGGKLILASGNHRVKAAIAAGVNAIPAIIVVVNDTGFLDIGYQDNEKHGLRLSHLEDEAAIINYKNLGLSAAEISKRTNFSEYTISSTLRAQEIRDALMADGFRQAHKLSRSQADALSKEPFGPVRITLARFALERDLGKKSLKQVIDAIAHKRDQADRLAAARTVVDDLFPKGGNGSKSKKGSSRPEAAKSLQQLRMCTGLLVLNVDPDQLAAQLKTLTSEELAKLESQVDGALSRLDDVYPIISAARK